MVIWPTSNRNPVSASVVAQPNWHYRHRRSSVTVIVVVLLYEYALRFSNIIIYWDYLCLSF